MVGTLPGVVGIYLTGWILQITGNDWKSVFLLAAALAVAGVLLYLFFVRTEEVDFDEKKDK